MDGTQGPRTERPQTANRQGAVVVTGERLARPTPMVGRQVQPQVQPGPDAQGPPESTNTVWGLPVWALVIAAFAGTALALVTISDLGASAGDVGRGCGAEDVLVPVEGERFYVVCAAVVVDGERAAHQQ